MGSKNSSSSILIILLLVFTFPIWIGITGGLFGLIVGVFGAAIGVVVGVLGAIVGIFGAIFGWLFHWNFQMHWPFAFFGSGFLFTMAVVLTIMLVTRSRKI